MISTACSPPTLSKPPPRSHLFQEVCLYWSNDHQVFPCGSLTCPGWTPTLFHFSCSHLGFSYLFSFGLAAALYCWVRVQMLWFWILKLQTPTSEKGIKMFSVHLKQWTNLPRLTVPEVLWGLYLREGRGNVCSMPGEQGKAFQGWPLCSPAFTDMCRQGWFPSQEPTTLHCPSVAVIACLPGAGQHGGAPWQRAHRPWIKGIL